ncbi:hypothetical protein DOY81_015528 [Sarcophaga bullata]|nr:hypothetical protein DOY81_015528 [Sarcophaga bullata]
MDLKKMLKFPVTLSRPPDNFIEQEVNDSVPVNDSSCQAESHSDSKINDIPL